jgi:hypothetical protein
MSSKHPVVLTKEEMAIQKERQRFIMERKKKFEEAKRLNKVQIDAVQPKG